MIIHLKFMNPFKEENNKREEENKESYKREKDKNMEDRNNPLLNYQEFLKNRVEKSKRVKIYIIQCFILFIL